MQVIDKKVRNNVIYSALYQVLTVVTPLITTPYISRVLTAEGVGEYSYRLSIASYFTLFVGLGFSLYGVVKVAQIRDDKKLLSKLFWEIMLAKVVLLLGALAAYYTIFLSQRKDLLLHIIMSFGIISTALDVTWLLNGLEEFKITLVRSTVVRIVNLLAIFFLVKKSSDLWLYALITQGSDLVSQFALYPAIRKHIQFTPIAPRNVIKHLKASLVYFIPSIVHTVFTSTDKTMLCYMCNIAEVGYYEQANKLCNLCMSTICSASTVLLPRITYMHQKGDTDVSEFIGRLVDILLFFSIPVMLGLAAASNNFVPIFFGEGYEKTAMLMKILCLNVLIMVLCNFCGQQCLIAKGKQRQYNIAVVLGAIFNVIFNAVFISLFASAGAAFASVISGIINLGAIFFFAKKEVNLKNHKKNILQYTLAGIVMLACVLLTGHYIIGIVGLIFEVVVGVVVYFAMLIFLHNELVITVIQTIKAKKSR